MTAADDLLGPYPSIGALAAAYRSGTVRPSDVVAAHLERIAARDPKLGAYQAVYADEARTAATAADTAIASGQRLGPFHGIPFALKDIIDLEGRVTTCGSEALIDRVSPATGTLARRLLAAGGVLLGKTKTVECAFGAWGTNQRLGTPWNPWDPDIARVPGGSSSGSAVAVAAGLAVCAVGTDTGGSVRLPAAFCGLAGLKTTEGTLPTDGILPLSHTLDTPGPMARSVADAALMYRVMAGDDPAAVEGDAAAGRGLFGAIAKSVRGMRLGVLDDAERETIDADILALYDSALARLEHLGAETASFTPPLSYAEMTERTGRIMAPESYAYHGALYEDRSLPLDEDVRARILGGRDVALADYIRLLIGRPAAQRDHCDAMGTLDAVLTPTTAVTALPLGDVDQTTTPGNYTRPVNYLGMCALSIPMGLTPPGLPGGMQIAARGGDEATALRIGAALEAALDPIGHPPLA